MKMKTYLITLILLLDLSIMVICQDYPDDFFTSEKQTIKSEILNQERILFIYLPNDYFKDSTQSYPVHYVADAPTTSNLYFDLIRLHGLLNLVPQSIVVGLSSDDREYNLHPDKGAEKYLQFIESEVIPFIDKTYRTKSFRVLAGHSLSGDFTIYTLLKNPSICNAYISGSPGPIESILNMIKDIKESINMSDNYKYFFTSIGSQDFTDTASFRQFEKLFKNVTDSQIDCHFYINKGENHISNIAINFQKGITSLYHDWQFKLPDELEKPINEVLKDHYNNLEKKFGYKIDIDEWEVIFPTMDKLAKRGDFENAINILKYCIELYPKSDQAYAFLAKAYFDTGKMDLGKQYLGKSLELNPDNQFSRRMKMMIEKQ